jgi:hypothetical protein
MLSIIKRLSFLRRRKLSPSDRRAVIITLSAFLAGFLSVAAGTASALWVIKTNYNQRMKERNTEYRNAMLCHSQPTLCPKKVKPLYFIKETY